MARPRKPAIKFIEEAIIVHGNKYNYSHILKSVGREKVTIICPTHGIFSQEPRGHLRGLGCDKCSGSANLTLNDFLKKANTVHNNKYSYEKTIFKGVRHKVCITCKIHGDFFQTPSDHFKGRGCPVCGKITNGNKRKIGFERFVERSKEIHNNKYDYSLVVYKNNRLKVKIICKKHGVFEQSPGNHLMGTGCPRCVTCKHEMKIKKWLDSRNIIYVMGKRFESCRGKKYSLPFDFYIPHLNMCIEYDGKQHYIPIYGEEDLISRKHNDSIKTNFCKDSGIKLLRIPYWEASKLLSILEENILVHGIIE